MTAQFSILVAGLITVTKWLQQSEYPPWLVVSVPGEGGREEAHFHVYEVAAPGAQPGHCN